MSRRARLPWRTVPYLEGYRPAYILMGAVARGPCHGHRACPRWQWWRLQVMVLLARAPTLPIALVDAGRRIPHGVMACSTSPRADGSGDTPISGQPTGTTVTDDEDQRVIRRLLPFPARWQPITAAATGWNCPVTRSTLGVCRRPVRHDDGHPAHTFSDNADARVNCRLRPPHGSGQLDHRGCDRRGSAPCPAPFSLRADGRWRDAVPEARLP